MRNLICSVLAAVSVCMLNVTGRADELSPEEVQTVTLAETPRVRIRLKVRNRASLADRRWIAIEIENRTKENIGVRHASYSTDRRCHDLETGKLINSGSLASGNTYDMFPWDLNKRPVPAVLKPGVYRVTDQISDYSAALLGLAPKSGYTVQATIRIQLELTDGTRVSESSGNHAFQFSWLHPTAEEIEGLRASLRHEFANPLNRPYHGYYLGALLNVPEVARTVSLQELLVAMRPRTGAFAGRGPILRFLNQHYRNDPQLIAWLLSRIKRGEGSVVFELIRLSDIWHPSFVEPLVTLYEQDRQVRYQLLNLLNSRGAGLVENQALARRLSAAYLADRSLKSASELERTKPDRLDDAIRFQGQAMAHLGLTRDRNVIPLLVPWLTDERVIYDPRLSAAIPIGYLPPLRLCDAAMEGIALLEGAPNAQSLYGDRLALPQGRPDLDKQIEVITKVRNELIAKMGKRFAAADD